MADLFDRVKSELSDRYLLERELGRGGMATVYLAADRRHGRQVAVKVLHPELASTVGSERFLREIRIAAQLTHPHILPLHDSGQAGEFLYYVMPFVDGESLRARMARDRQLSITHAVQIVREVADALACAHGQGIVHRDIKPENILFSGRHAVVTDFGVAKALSAAADQDQLTTIGLAVGTPVYMSPEQAMGETDLDGRSDIYSLGIVLFELLTGEQPFSGTTPQSVLAKRLTTPAPLIRAFRTVPQRLETVVQRCLAREAADRVGTAEELERELRAIELDTPTRTSGAAVVPASVDPSIAVLPFTNLSPDPENEYFSEGITEEIINALSKVGGLRVAARSSSFAFKGRSVDLAEVGTKLRVDTVLEGSVRKAGNRVRITAQLIKVSDGYHLWSERYDRELEDVFAIQDEIGGAIVETLKIKLLGPSSTPPSRKPDNLDAYDLYLKGRYFWYQRGDGLAKGLECFQQAVALDPEYALAYAGLADSYNLLGFYHYQLPRDVFPKATTAALKALELDDSLAEAHTSLAYAKMVHDWDWDGAEREFRRALACNPAYATAHHWFSEYLMAMGRVDEALSEANQARELDVLGLVINTLVGMALYYGRRYEQAIQEFQRIMEMEPHVIAPYLWLGLAYTKAERHDEAVHTLERACQLPGALPHLLGYVGLAYGARGDVDKAAAIMRDLEAASRTQYVSLFAKAFGHLGMGETDQALTALETACEERDASIFWIQAEPALDALRDDPRFQAVVRTMGLA